MSADGHSGSLSMLLRQYTDLNSVIHDNIFDPRTPQLLAAESRSLDKVYMLIEAGTNPILPALWGLTRTPLQAAVGSGQEGVVEYLLQKGADPKEPPAPRSGATALQLAAINSFIGIAVILLNKGADINAKPALIDGRTAYEGAIEYGRIDMMSYLVQSGANLHADDQQQFRRAVKFAEESGQHVARELAQELLRSTQRGERVHLIRQEDTEPDILHLDTPDDFFPNFVRFPPNL